MTCHQNPQLAWHERRNSHPEARMPIRWYQFSDFGGRHLLVHALKPHVGSRLLPMLGALPPKGTCLLETIDFAARRSMLSLYYSMFDRVLFMGDISPECMKILRGCLRERPTGMPLSSFRVMFDEDALLDAKRHSEFPNVCVPCDPLPADRALRMIGNSSMLNRCYGEHTRQLLAERLTLHCEGFCWMPEVVPAAFTRQTANWH